jgi:dTDP-4-dehydrorhamnose reductase
MKILVTGSNGLLGQKLSNLLQSQPGVDLIATARDKSVVSFKSAVFYPMDICDPQQVMDVIPSVKPHVVIHAAAMTLVDKCESEQELCWKANVTAVENIISACESVRAHLVMISTDFIFDGSNGPLTEQDEPSPVNFYGVSKLAAERLVMKSSLNWSILRTVLVYGITQDLGRSNIVLWVKDSLEQGKTIQVVNDQWRTPTLAEDLAMGCYLAASKKAKGIFNVSGKDFITPYEMAIKTAEYFDLDKSLIKSVDSSSFKQTARRPLKTGFIIEKAKRELGYEPHSFAEGLQIIARQISKVAIS